MRLKHDPQMQIVAPSEHYDPVQFWSPTVMQSEVDPEFEIGV
jgi:hypothetical protein